MPLFIDSDQLTQTDLIALEPDALKMAQACGISINGDRGIIRKSWNEAARWIMANTQAYGVYDYYWPLNNFTGTSNGLGANRPRLGMNQIVIPSNYGRFESPIAQWLIYRALELFYRECVARVDNDRYQRKWDNARQQLERAEIEFWNTGLPFVSLPLECPGAAHALNAGDWATVSNYVINSGGGFASDSALNTAITWVDQSNGYVSAANKNNAESGPSATLVVSVASGHSITLNVNGLTPPVASSSANGTTPPRGIADGPYITRGATGWNLYAGLQSDSRMYLQNAQPIALSATFTLSQLVAGPVLLPGQFADRNHTFIRTIFRG